MAKKQKYYHFTFRKRKISVLLDKVLFFRYLQHLRGRFWGVAALTGLLIGFGICFIIRPELRDWSTAFSDFGDDIRTAPYFAGSLFFAAYGLWRWRNYLQRTVKRARPIMGLLTITIFSLLTIAFMPQSWGIWPYRVHLFAVTTLGLSILLTVVIDGLLSKTKPGKNVSIWRVFRFISFWLIIFGAWITFVSIQAIGWYDLQGLGELLMIFGYGLWVIVKTYRGDGGRTTLSKILHGFVVVD